MVSQIAQPMDSVWVLTLTSELVPSVTLIKTEIFTAVLQAAPVQRAKTNQLVLKSLAQVIASQSLHKQVYRVSARCL